MRMVKMEPKSIDLETAMQKFLPVRESQHTGEETMKDYQRGSSRQSLFAVTARGGETAC